MKFLALSLLLLTLAGCNSQKKEPKFDDKALMSEVKEVLEPLPDSLIDKEKNVHLISLGKKLYFDKGLSVNDTISCNSCHNLKTYGVDNEPTSPGHDGTRGGRNSPTVYNAGLHISQFWDGRAKDLAEQAIGPLLNPIEHGLKDEESALKKVGSKEYLALFQKAFGNDKSFNYKNIGVAIAAFEKTLLTPSRFDDYIKGDLSALTYQEKVGLKRFNEIGCTSCHDGPAIGGSSYQKLGAVVEYKTKDMGRYEITKDEDDKMVFKVPSLRNVTQTAPYFHDGTVQTLDEAIRLMAKHQLGEEISVEDTKSIKSFLTSLEAKKLPQI